MKIPVALVGDDSRGLRDEGFDVTVDEGKVEENVVLRGDEVGFGPESDNGEKSVILKSLTVAVKDSFHGPAELATVVCLDWW